MKSPIQHRLGVGVGKAERVEIWADLSGEQWEAVLAAVGRDSRVKTLYAGNKSFLDADTVAAALTKLEDITLSLTKNQSVALFTRLRGRETTLKRLNIAWSDLSSVLWKLTLWQPLSLGIM